MKKRNAFTSPELGVGIIIVGLLSFFAYQYFFGEPDDTEAETIRMEIDNR
jgi:type II secretory pathway pseudopilin PulG